jgi:hypothetical protein
VRNGKEYPVQNKIADDVRNGKEYPVQNKMEKEENKKAYGTKRECSGGGVVGRIGETVGTRVKGKEEEEGKGRREDNESEGGYNCGTLVRGEEDS